MTLREMYDFHMWFSRRFQHLLEMRYHTLYQALLLAVGRNAMNIVETGTTRKEGNWFGDGQSTFVFGAFANRYNGRLWTCDINEANIDVARRATAAFGASIEYIVGDSVRFLTEFERPIDFLYLDSLDIDKKNDPSAAPDHALREGQAAQHALTDQSIILVDDCGAEEGGKGSKVIPFFLEQGWQITGCGYQMLLTKQGSIQP